MSARRIQVADRDAVGDGPSVHRAPEVCARSQGDGARAEREHADDSPRSGGLGVGWVADAALAAERAVKRLDTETFYVQLRDGKDGDYLYVGQTVTGAQRLVRWLKANVYDDTVITRLETYPRFKA